MLGRQLLSWSLGLLLLVVTVEGLAEAVADEVPEAVDRSAIGLTIGLTRTKFGGSEASSDIVENRYALGWSVGVEVTHALHKWFGIEAAPSIVRRGARVVPASAPAGTFEFYYFDLPVSLQFTPPLESPIQPYLVVGGRVSFLVAATLASDSGNSIDYRDEARAIDAGLMAGGGAKLKVSRAGAVRLDVRYDFGLVRVDDTEEMDDIKNRGLFITIGYQHNLGDLVDRIRGAPRRDAVGPAEAAEPDQDNTSAPE